MEKIVSTGSGTKDTKNGSATTQTIHSSIFPRAIDYANNVGVWVPHSNDHYYDYGKGNTYGLSGIAEIKIGNLGISNSDCIINC